MVNLQEEDASFDEWHETLVRVRYSETDKMGVVYHANYLIWFEIGRTEFCRARGFSYRDMEENEDAWLVVAESYCRYKAPAYYDDELIVRTDGAGRVRSFPTGYTQLLAATPESAIHLSQTPDRRVPEEMPPD